MKYVLILCVPILMSWTSPKDRTLVLTSPDKNIEAHIQVSDSISMAVYHNKIKILSAENISMIINAGLRLGNKSAFLKSEHSKIKETIKPEIREKYESIRDRYNKLVIEFKDSYSMEFRAYDNGLAYRFLTDQTDSIIVQDEILSLRFMETDSVILQLANGFRSSYETPYEKFAVLDVPLKKYIHLPYLVQRPDGISLVITESDLSMKVKGFKNEDEPPLPEKGTLVEQVEALEKKLIFDALSEVNGNQTKAGKLLGLTERNLRYKLKKYDIKN